MIVPAAAGGAPRTAEQNLAAVMAQGLQRAAKSLRAERMRLRDFFAPAWKVVNPGVPYIPNWHNDLIAEHLEAVHIGQIKLLNIAMPPRMGKSFHVTTAFPDWEWSEDPAERFIFASYNQKLCTRHSLDRRAIIQSAWYQNRWGEFVKLADDQNLKTEFQNTARGHMVTAPFGSSATGSGGRRLIIDDPLNPTQAASKIQREACYDFYRNTLTTRLDDEKNSAVIMVAQRTDVEDLQGRVCFEKDGWTNLVIPMEAMSRTVYVFPISKTEKVYEVGELLCPARKSRLGVAALRRSMGEHTAAAQLDQAPEAASGNLFPRTCWKVLAAEPAPLFVLTIWDTAVKEKQQNDPSAGVTIIKHATGYHVCRGIVNEQMRFSALKRAVVNKFEIDKPDAIFVEDKSSGSQVIQEMHDETSMPVIIFDPAAEGEVADKWRAWFKMDKHARASLVQPLWQAGRVSYDPNMENAAQMVEQFARFPKVAHDDMVDAVVHGVRYLSLLDAFDAPEEAGEFEDTPAADLY